MMEMGQEQRTVAIIGSGFSGTSAAIHILRAAIDRPIRVILIERGPEFGRGLAYAQSDFPALLNVPASRMSAALSDPNEFLQFARLRDPSVTGEDFLPRSLYGDYLQHLLKSAAAKARPGVQLECTRGEVVEVAEPPGAKAIALTMADGKRLAAHSVIFATGAPMQQMLAGMGFATAPWSNAAVVRLDSQLVVGTGLTMVDTVCSLLGRSSTLRIHALSRHGLMPLGQTAFRPDALQDDGGLLSMSAGSVSRLFAAARLLARETERRGGDWREVVTQIRHQAPALWRSLSITERSRFLRHARAYWDVHRHRVPQSVLARLNDWQSSGRLQVHAGRLLSLASSGGGIRATFRPRGTTQSKTLDIDKAIDCTGLNYDVARAPDRLWQTLLAQGHVTSDGLKLGVRTGLCGALVGREGRTSHRLYYVGPMLRSDYWEATAVAELKIHVERLVRRVLDRSFETSRSPVTTRS